MGSMVRDRRPAPDSMITREAEPLTRFTRKSGCLSVICPIFAMAERLF